MPYDTNINDIIKQGLDSIDNELDKEVQIRDQANLIIQDLLNNNYRSKIRVEDTLYLFLLSTGNKRVLDTDNKYKLIPTYVLQVYNMDKLYSITNNNVSLIESITSANNVGLHDNRIKPVIKNYKPYTFEVEIEDEFETEQLLNTLVSTSVAYLLGEFIVEEMPE